MTNSMSDTSTSGRSINLPSFPPPRPRSSQERLKPKINVPGSVRRHWSVFLFVLLLLLVCGSYILWKKEKPIYQSHSVVYVAPKFPKMLAGDSEVDLPYESYIQDQIQTVTRYDIIAEAISQLPYSIRHRTGSALPYEIQELQQRLEVKRIGSTYEVSIALSGPVPDALADTVNTVTQTYVERAKSEEFYSLNDRLKTLRLEKVRLREEMDQSLGEQAHLMQQLGVATLSSGVGATNPYDSSLEKVRDQVATARIQRQTAEAQLHAVLQGRSTVSDATADEDISADPGLSGVRSALTSRRAALVQEMSGLRPDHPLYQKDETDLASIDGQMNELRRSAADRLEEKLLQEVTRTRLVEINLIQELGKKTNAATSAAPKFQRAAALGPEIDSLQRAFDAVGDRIRDLELESSSPGSIHMSTKARVPLGPEPSRLPISLLALILISLTFACAAPVAIDRLDNKLYTSEDVERVVGFHPLSILLDDYEFSQDLVDEYDFRLAAAIDHVVRTYGARTFLFTSTAHGSGTSTVVKKLSDKLRRLNLRTKIVTDSEPFLRVNAPLSSDLALNGQKSPSGLWASPSAKPHTYAGYHKDQGAAVLETAMGAIHHVSESSDAVLIDAAPLPISAYTEYLARSVDATVLIVGSSTTTKQDLEHAARLLERLEVPGVAVILNKISLGRADSALKREFRSYEKSLKLHRPGTEKASA